jgi:H+/Cl- antiporter ClcA
MRKLTELGSTFFHLNRFRPVLFLKSVLVGVLTGLVVVAFRLLLNASVDWRHGVVGTLKEAGPGPFVFWTGLLVAAGLLLGLAVRYFPHVRGSGIPEVKGVVLRQLDIKWFPEILVKFFGGLMAQALGMSLGREGPSIQLGAFVGEGVLQCSKRPHLERKFLISSGAAAGVAAAFNAPLAGVMFVLEEIHKTLSPMMLMCAMGASVVANLVAGQFFGLQPAFTFVDVEPLPLRLFPYILLLGVVIAFCADLFKRLLYAGQHMYVLMRIPRVLRPIPPLLVSFFAGIHFFEITGGGHEMIESLVDLDASLRTMLLLLGLKVLLTVFCYGSGTPGGIFLPLLLTGALIGHIFGYVLLQNELIEPHHLLNFMILGMAAQFTGVVGAPITGSILVLEMSGNLNHLSGLLGVCMVSYVMADWLNSRPVYDVLLRGMVRRNPELALEDERKAILEIPVCAGSLLDQKQVREVEWPEGTLVVGIRRGGGEILPTGESEILFGDLVSVLVSEGRAPDVMSPLLALGTETRT